MEDLGCGTSGESSLANNNKKLRVADDNEKQQDDEIGGSSSSASNVSLMAAEIATLRHQKKELTEMLLHALQGDFDWSKVPKEWKDDWDLVLAVVGGRGTDRNWRLKWADLPEKWQSKVNDEILCEGHHTH